MIKEAIEKVVEMAFKEVKEVELFDRIYSNRKFEPIMPPKDPGPPCLTVDTLQGLVDFLKSGFDGAEIGSFLPSDNTKPADQILRVALIVESPSNARAFLPINGFYKERHTVCSAVWEEATFPFDRFISQEEFVISALARIQPGEDLDAVFECAGKIVCEDKAEITDNGVSQAVTVQRGVKQDAGKILPLRPTLRPVRTFTEVEQPASQFVFRMQSDPIRLALFEADMGAWKMEAKRNIKKFLEEQLPGVPVFL